MQAAHGPDEEIPRRCRLYQQNWEHWHHVGGALNRTGEIELFGIKNDSTRALVHAQLFDLNQSRLATIVDDTGPAARIHVFSLGNGFLWHRWETAAGGGRTKGRGSGGW